MVAPDVDVVVAIHDPRRDIARSVGSALTSASVARVIVVCHNTPVDGIAAALGPLAADGRVQLEALDDGLRSPAGPFNRGLDLATARFTSIMGSDDELAVGAIDAWAQAAVRERADVVVPPLRHAGGRLVPTPPTRPRRVAGLDGIRDRLSYRTAPLGLVSRERFGTLRLTPGLATGEDLAYATRLWFSGASITRVRSGADYVVHDDAERVTFTRRPIDEELAAVVLLTADDWVLGLPDAARVAIAVKLWRLAVFGAVHYRAGAWLPADRAALAHVADALGRFAPAALEVLSRADSALVTAIRDQSVPDAALDARSSARRRFATPGALLPARSGRILAREAPLRFAAATWFAGSPLG